MIELPPVPDRADLPAIAEDAVSRVGLADPALAYDYFKSMVSVSVGTLGGILALGEAVFGAQIAPWQMGVPALLVAMSGVLALQAKTDIVQLCQGIKPPLTSSRVALRLVPALYGMGLGTFIVFLSMSYVAA